MSKIARIVGLALIAPLTLAAASTFHSIHGGGPPSILVFLVSALFYAVWTLGLSVFALTAAFQGAWNALGYRCVCVAALVVCFLPIWKSGDYLHLALFFPIYAQQIYAAPEKDALRFEWGDAAGFVTDGLVFRTLVYDRSGASEAHLKASQPAEDGMRVYTRHLVGRFYVETLH